MSYHLIITKDAEKDIQFLKKNDVFAYKKLTKLLIELVNHPRTGTGKPKILRNSDNIYARRITKKHRLLYRINDEEIIVIVISALGHYDDK